MPYEMDTDDGFNPEGGSYNNISESGTYHVHVTGIDEESDGNAVVVDYEVLGGLPDSQVGKTFRDYFNDSLKARGRIVNLMLGAKLTTVDAMKAAKDEGRPVIFEFSQLVGRELMIEVAMEEYQGKIRPKCGFGIYATDDDRAKAVLNQGALGEGTGSTEAAAGSTEASKDAATEGGGGGATEAKEDDNLFG
ncbi:MAG: hypothetical protein GY832_24325 [Chloroflexi bacterium]|nr:hypothetical protein [Chloroflexota bacterium]